MNDILKLIKEPLLHFLLIGAFLFWVYHLANPAESENVINIDDNLIAEMVAKWELQRSRQPTTQELLGMLDQYIRQEVLYQEALAMNLDHNDEIVKRRLAQKMEFISDEMTETLQPDEEVLINYYVKNRENYRKSSIYSLNHIFFNTEERKKAKNDALSVLDSSPEMVEGDQIGLPLTYEKESALKIARDYGEVFTSKLDSLPVDKWSGPIPSAYGWHLVYITDRKDAGYYAFEEIKDKVIIDYNFEATERFKEELITSLLKNYTINVEVNDIDLNKELNEIF